MPDNNKTQNRYLIYAVKHKNPPANPLYASLYNKPGQTKPPVIKKSIHDEKNESLKQIQSLLTKVDNSVRPYVKQVNISAINTTISAFCASNGLKTELIDFAIKSGSSKKAVDVELETITKTLGKGGARYLKIAKGANFHLGWVSAGLVAADAYKKGEWENHHTADLAIAIGSIYLLTGPIG